MLRAVTFDLWETLIHEDAECEIPRRDYRVREVGRVLRAASIDVTDEALVRAHKEVFIRMDPFWGSNLDLSVLEQVRMFIELAAGGSVDAKLPPAGLLEASKHYSEAALKYPPRQADGARASLAAARAAGMRLGLLCNTGRTPGKVLREVLNLFEMRQFFEVLCFSDEVRIRKPATEFFTRALQRLGVRPEDCVHVGDMPDTDLIGARSAGMRTVHVRREGTPAAQDGLADYVIPSIADLPGVLQKVMTSPSPAPTPGPPKTPRPSDFGKETTLL